MNEELKNKLTERKEDKMNEQELKQYLKDNLRIYADFEDGLPAKRIVITISLGREKISETKLWLDLI